MKRMPKRFFVALIIAVISVVAIVFYIHSSKYQHTDDAYLESHMVSVAPKVTGQIIEVYIDDFADYYGYWWNYLCDYSLFKNS